MMRVPIAISARHAHLSRPTLDLLFGHGHELRIRTWLSQAREFSAEETVSLIGPRGRLDRVRLLGPLRAQDQVEISRSDGFVLGIDAPVRVSGELHGTPGVTVKGPAGTVQVPSGLIAARRHIHMSPEESRQLRLRHGETVSVKVDSDGRDLVFGDVSVRVADGFRLELHIDTDEANAAGLGNGSYGEIISAS